jgi:hypothetical protein
MSEPLSKIHCSNCVTTRRPSLFRPQNRLFRRWGTALLLFGMSVAACTAAIYEGLEHTPLGNATLTVQGNQMAVDNLGSSGQDGVSILLPTGLSAFEAHWQDPDPLGALPQGAALVQQMVGVGSTGTPSVLGSVQVTKAGISNYVITADFSPLVADSHNVQAFLNGVLVGEVNGQTGPVGQSRSMNWSADLEIRCCPLETTISVDFGGGGTSVALNGGAIVVCDHLYITPVGAVLTTPPTAFQILAKDVPSLHFVGEDVTVTSGSVTYQNLQNTALGKASLAKQGNQLTVANIGSSGQDGVSIALPGSLTALETHWIDLDANDKLPPGAFVSEQVIGPSGGIPGIVLGSVTALKSGSSNILVSADFGALGVKSFTVRAFRQGALVAKGSGLAGGSLARASSFPSSADLEVSCCPLEVTLSIDWGSTATSLLVNGSSVLCDHLFITPEGATYAGPPTAVQITAAQVPPITITAENETVVYQGLANTSLGNASLELQKNQLSVANIGSSGQDGVSIALPSTLSALETHWLDPDAGDVLPVGAFIRETVNGASAGFGDGPLGSVTVFKAGTSNVVLSADFASMGATTYTVRAYLHGALVTEATGLSGAGLARASSFGFSADIIVECCPLGSVTVSVDWGSSATSLRVNGTTVTSDHVLITPEGVSLSGPPTALQITAAQVPLITITAENETVMFGGLANTSVGNASLTLQGSQMVVANIGSSGQDGVSIALPSTLSALETHWLDPDSGDALPVGAFIREQVTGSAVGIVDGPLGNVTMLKAGTSNIVISADFASLGASNYTVQAYLQGALVAQASGLDGAALATARNIGLSVDISSTCCPLEITVSVDWGHGSTSLLLNGASVTCDHLYIKPESVTLSSAPTSVQITGSQIGSLTFIAENQTILYGGLANTAVGDATLTLAGRRLEIHNLGSSGQDGVSIEWPSTLTGLETHWDDVDANDALPTGAFLREQVIGSASGITNGPVGSLTMLKAGTSNIVISADFASMGATTYTVRAYLQGVQVAQATGLNGAALASAKNMGLSFDFEAKCCPAEVTVSIDWGHGSTDLLLNGVSVACDHLFITPEGGTLSGPPTALQITAAQIGSLTITGENQTVSYAGLSNTAVGDASLTLAGRRLEIRNLGSSGQDGVSIELPSTLAGLETHWDDVDANDALPTGAFLREQVIGSASGITNGPLGSVTMLKAGTSNIVISADFAAMGVTTYTVRAYLQGVQVAQATGLNGAGLASAKNMGFSFDIEVKCCPPEATISLDWGHGSTGLLLNGVSVACDHLYITPEGGTLSSSPTAVQITGSQIGSLTITGENQTLVYAGLSNTAVGDASLTLAGRRLEIRNLGSSGQDGVSIELPSTLAGLETHWDDVDANDALPTGAFLREQVVGSASGITNGPLGSLTMLKAGTSNIVISADFASMGATTYTVRAYLQGVQVAQATGLNGAALASAKNIGLSFDFEVKCCPTQVTVSIEWGHGSTGLLLNGASVTCDHLTITPEGGTLSGPPTALQITAAQIGSLTITGENQTVSYAGLSNTALGDASLTLAGRRLEIRNLGSSGQDGVAVELPSTLAGLETHWDDVDANDALPTGAFLREQVIGSASGITNGPLGSVTMLKAGTSNIVISADFAAMGVTTYTVRAYLQGVQVAQATGLNGAGLASAKNMGFSFDIEVKCCPPGASYSIDWGHGSTGLLLNGVSVACDHLYITPEGGTLSSSPTAVQITGSQIGSLTITGENQTVLYAGLSNTAVGDASLGLEGGRLKVSNIGSSGQDGVAIVWPNGATGLQTHWDDVDAGDVLPVGAYVRQQVIGSAPGIVNGPLGSVTMLKAGTSNILISADFASVGASTYRVEAYLQGVLVAKASGLNGAALATARNMGLSADLEIKCCPVEVTVSVDWGHGSTSLLVNGASVTCDHLFITPEGVTFPSTPTGVQITASNVETLSVSAENLAIKYDGLSNTALGTATLSLQGSQLIVDNLGSSGQDGVAIDLPSTLTGLETHWLDPDAAGTLPAGAFVRQQVIGSASGITNGPLGSVTVAKAGQGNVVINADFGSLGVTTYTARAYLRGQLVAEASGLNGAGLARASSFAWSNDSGYSCCPWEITISVDWGSSATSLLMQGAAVTCDHLVITPQGLSLPTRPTGVQITASQIPSLTITGENQTLSYGGLAVASVGSAALTLQNNQLTVDNLGSSGQDGVSIGLPSKLTGLEVHWNDLDAAGVLPVQAYVREQLIGSAPGFTNAPLGGVTVVKAGTSNVLISADFSAVGATTYAAKAYLHGALVAEASGLNGAGLAAARGMNLSFDFKYTCCPTEWTISVDWGGGDTALRLNGASVTCDHLFITPEGAVFTGPPTAMQITGSQVAGFTFTDTTVTPLTLGLTSAPGALTLEWFGTGTLQETSDLNGWTNVPNATSPYTAPIGPTSRFFRVNQPAGN